MHQNEHSWPKLNIMEPNESHIIVQEKITITPKLISFFQYKHFLPYSILHKICGLISLLYKISTCVQPVRKQKNHCIKQTICKGNKSLYLSINSTKHTQIFLF